MRDPATDPVGGYPADEWRLLATWLDSAAPPVSADEVITGPRLVAPTRRARSSWSLIVRAAAVVVLVVASLASAAVVHNRSASVPVQAGPGGGQPSQGGSDGQGLDTGTTVPDASILPSSPVTARGWVHTTAPWPSGVLPEVAAAFGGSLFGAGPDQRGQLVAWNRNSSGHWSSSPLPVIRQRGFFHFSGAATSDGTAILLGTGDRTMDEAIPMQTVSAAWVSHDGVRWQALGGDPFPGGFAESVTANEAGFVAVGDRYDDPGVGAVWTSTDGEHWALEDEPALAAPATVARLNVDRDRSVHLTTVVARPGAFLATGRIDPAAPRSAPGDAAAGTTTAASAPASTPPATTAGPGQPYATVLWSSSDGRHWVEQAWPDAISPSQTHTPTVFGGAFAIREGQQLWTSADGANWVAHDLELGDLLPAGTHLPAVGSAHGLVLAGRPTNFNQFPRQSYPFALLISGDGVHVEAVPDVVPSDAHAGAVVVPRDDGFTVLSSDVWDWQARP